MDRTGEHRATPQIQRDRTRCAECLGKVAILVEQLLGLGAATEAYARPGGGGSPGLHGGIEHLEAPVGSPGRQVQFGGEGVLPSGRRDGGGGGVAPQAEITRRAGRLIQLGEDLSCIVQLALFQ